VLGSATMRAVQRPELGVPPACGGELDNQTGPRLPVRAGIETLRPRGK
jgi:hypothetical protein